MLRLSLAHFSALCWLWSRMGFSEHTSVFTETLSKARVTGFVGTQLGELRGRTADLVGKELTVHRKKLSSLRRSILPYRRPFAPKSNLLLDDSWQDRAGSCSIRLKRAQRHIGGAALYIRVSGVGSKQVCRESVDALEEAFVSNELSQPVTTYVDMSGAVACSPQGVQRCIKFVCEHGSAFDHVAVVAHGLSLHSVRFIVYVTRLQTVRVFDSWENAYGWLTTETRPAVSASESWTRADELKRMRRHPSMQLQTGQPKPTTPNRSSPHFEDVSS